MVKKQNKKRKRKKEKEEGHGNQIDQIPNYQIYGDQSELFCNNIRVSEGPRPTAQWNR